LQGPQPDAKPLAYQLDAAGLLRRRTDERTTRTHERGDPGRRALLAAADDGDPLALTPDQMRELGYQTVDLLVERITDSGMRAMRRASPEQLAARISGSIPRGGRSWPELLAGFDDGVLANMSRLAHPRYFAFIPASSTFPGALGDLVASALDIDAGSWSSAAGPSHLELVVLEWFKQWIGYPARAGGLLVSGGSAANITA
jgi:aromatic-L-amino-acid decarboxylase